jgi:hypothetical protein
MNKTKIKRILLTTADILAALLIIGLVVLALIFIATS